jgi:hypothetical protein
VAPAVISRDGDGNATVRATRRDTDNFDRFSAPSNRALTVKVNRLLRL